MALRNYKPTSPSRRNLVLIDRSDLWKGKPEKGLTEGLSSNCLLYTSDAADE